MHQNVIKGREHHSGCFPIPWLVCTVWQTAQDWCTEAIALLAPPVSIAQQVFRECWVILRKCVNLRWSHSKGKEHVNWHWSTLTILRICINLSWFRFNCRNVITEPYISGIGTWTEPKFHMGNLIGRKFQLQTAISRELKKLSDICWRQNSRLVEAFLEVLRTEDCLLQLVPPCTLKGIFVLKSLLLYSVVSNKIQACPN